MRTLSIVLCASVLFLAGCPSAPIRGQLDETSPDFLVPAGSTLVLHEPLEIPAWQDQIYFQEGRTMSWRGVNIYIPYCTLKMAAKQETAQSIRPDAFVVKKTYTELFFMQVRAPMPGDGIQLAVFESREAMDYKVVAAVMELISADQPEVTDLLCADWGLPPERPHITVNKIRRALGAVMTLELAQHARVQP